jgi:hypothetical protein
MKINMLNKILIVSVIFLFVGMGFQPAFANEIPASNTKVTSSKVETRDFGLGFILCVVLHVDFIGRTCWIPWFVEFKLTDYDTGELIEKKNCLFGVHLFRFLPMGKNYMINVTTLMVSDTALVKNLGFFKDITIAIHLPYY